MLNKISYTAANYLILSIDIQPTTGVYVQPVAQPMPGDTLVELDTANSWLFSTNINPITKNGWWGV